MKPITREWISKAEGDWTAANLLFRARRNTNYDATLAQDGKLMLDELPFRAGDTVEVIILARQSKPNGREYPLRGQPIKYIEPTDPVAQADWDALQ